MVFQAFARRKDTWKTNLVYLAGARFWWQFSRAIHDMMSETRWAHDGSSPTMDVSVLLACIKGGQFPSVVDMPGKLMTFPPRGYQPAGKAPEPGKGATSHHPQSGDQPKVRRSTHTSSPSLKPSWTRPSRHSVQR
jgi:hypothetical protein